MKRQHIVFDTEIIGSEDPVFLVCCKVVETTQTFAFWHHRKNDLKKLRTLLDDVRYTWVGFNSLKFDLPLLTTYLHGHSAKTIKLLATKIIAERLMPWDAYALVGLKPLDIDHVDLFEVAPGRMVSLKTYAGRMHYPSMVDLPFHHDKDLTNKECRLLESYCLNDIGVTEALFKLLREDITLREDLGEIYDLDLRSKSSPQISEAVLKKVVGLNTSSKARPLSVNWVRPAIIKTHSKVLKDLMDKLEQTTFDIDNEGSPVLPRWLDENPLELRGGTYKVGIGGLHSQHDKQLYRTASDEWMISDFDVASYYPSLIMKCGYIPKLAGGKGQLFMDTYADIYKQRLEAKQNGEKKIAGVLKLALNGAYGKLGSSFCSFYAPELMLAVCLTGQLNLLNLIDAMGKQKQVEVLSANTDGITVSYPVSQRETLLKVVVDNARQTGFEYEETKYSAIAMKDVNNYIAVKINGEVKAKGLYAPISLEKNPTAAVCSLAAAEYLKNGMKPERFIKQQKKLEPFLSIRAVKGGGVQHTRYVEVDDWLPHPDEPRKWFRVKSDGANKIVTRVSRPPPEVEGQGGLPFGRIARWYMSTKQQPAITYCSNGNQVPKTEGAQLCMTLPTTLPADLDYTWYVREAYEMLSAMGLTFESNSNII